MICQIVIGDVGNDQPLSVMLVMLFDLCVCVVLPLLGEHVLKEHGVMVDKGGRPCRRSY